MKEVNNPGEFAYLQFSSGRKLADIVGIGVTAIIFSGGYEMEVNKFGEFTKEEREELADFMIARWKAFKAG